MESFLLQPKMILKLIIMSLSMDGEYKIIPNIGNAKTHGVLLGEKKDILE